MKKIRNIVPIPAINAKYYLKTHIPGKRGDWRKALVYSSDKREHMLDMVEFFLATHNRVKVNSVEIFLIDSTKKYDPITNRWK
jgi:hypothetical protein